MYFSFVSVQGKETLVTFALIGRGKESITLVISSRNKMTNKEMIIGFFPLLFIISKFVLLFDFERLDKT